MDETVLRSIVPGVIAVLVRRGADFAAAEDAVQEALAETVRGRPGGEESVRDAKGWLITVAWRKFLDATRADSARRARRSASRANRRRARCPRPTTPSSCTSSAPTPRWPRRRRWRSPCAPSAG